MVLSADQLRCECETRFTAAEPSNNTSSSNSKPRPAELQESGEEPQPNVEVLWRKIAVVVYSETRSRHLKTGKDRNLGRLKEGLGSVGEASRSIILVYMDISWYNTVGMHEVKPDWDPQAFASDVTDLVLQMSCAFRCFLLMISCNYTILSNIR